MARNRTAAVAAPVAVATTDSGFITVRVGKLPGRIHEVALNGGRKVKDALEGAGLDPSGFETKVGTVAATMETDLKQGDTVLLVKKIRNNA